MWSPLLPPDIDKSRTAGKGPGSSSALPMAEGRWTGAATRATRMAAIFAITAAISAGALTWGLLIELGLYRGTHRGHWPVGVWLWMYAFAAMFALAAGGSWRDRRFFQKLDKAANGSARSRR